MRIVDIDYLRGILRHEDGKLFWISGRRKGKEAGCLRSDGRTVVRIGDRSRPLVMRYRIIWALVHGVYPDHEIDHINCNPSDDRPENLRAATSSQQKWNRRTTSRNKAGAKGVMEFGNKYTAQIQVNGKSTHIGVFDTVADASAAYFDFAKRVAGDFARAN